KPANETFEVQVESHSPDESTGERATLGETAPESEFCGNKATATPAHLHPAPAGHPDSGLASAECDPPAASLLTAQGDNPVSPSGNAFCGNKATATPAHLHPVPAGHPDPGLASAECDPPAASPLTAQGDNPVSPSGNAFCGNKATSGPLDASPRASEDRAEETSIALRRKDA
ncbi:MAG: hypothetical protein R2762_03745, partial [Bryobacteraceae bacterium]